MLRRRRQQRDKGLIMTAEDLARKILEEEIADLKQKVKEAKQETLRRRAEHQRQQQELHQEHKQAHKKLVQRRNTLLATTSLIPYTQTIQKTNNLHIPAPVLTLQARLCLHVHCLCVHEELLLKTKEQGWDTIAWMEDVSRQLRLLTQSQLQSLQQQRQTLVMEYQEQLGDNTKADLPEEIMQALNNKPALLQAMSSEDTLNEDDQDDAVQEQATNTTTITKTGATLQDMTPSSAEMLDQYAYQSSYAPDRSTKQDESFSQFLKRYEQRKQFQEKAHQMRLAEFRARDVTTNHKTTPRQNPFTARRAQVGRQLKNYAKNIFQGQDQDLEASLHWHNLDESQSEINGDDNTMLEGTKPSSSSNNNNNNKHNNRLHNSLTNLGVGQPLSSARQWVGKRLNGQRHNANGNNNSQSNLSQSESQLDTRSWTLGGSLRGLRNRGFGRRSRHASQGGMTTQTEEEDDNNESSSGSGDQGEFGQEEEDPVNATVVEKANPQTKLALAELDAALGAEMESSATTKKSAEENDRTENGKSTMDASLHQEDLLMGFPEVHQNDLPSAEAVARAQRRPSRSSNANSNNLKEKLKAPPIWSNARFSESARW